jgi:uncharacterized membrane protein
VTERRLTLESGHGLERTIFFSDAVIAIAMTLLALDLKVPTVREGKSVYEDFTEKLSHEYLAFLISFAVIGMFWYRHHRLFQHIARLTTRMIILNLVALFAVVLMPFATRLTTDMGDGPAASWGTVFYAGLMCAWAAVYLLMAWEAQRSGLWADTLPPAAIGNMVAGWTSAVIPFVLSMPVAFADPGLAKLIWILVAPSSYLTGSIRKWNKRRAEVHAAAKLQHMEDTDSERAAV